MEGKLENVGKHGYMLPALNLPCSPITLTILQLNVIISPYSLTYVSSEPTTDSLRACRTRNILYYKALNLLRPLTFAAFKIGLTEILFVMESSSSSSMMQKLSSSETTAANEIANCTGMHSTSCSSGPAEHTTAASRPVLPSV